MRTKRLWHGVFSACIGMLVFCVFGAGGVNEKVEAISWSWKSRHLSSPSIHSSKIKIILLDQASLVWGAQNDLSWPWPRQVHNPLIKFCKESGAKAIGFDVVFTEESNIVNDDLMFGQEIKEYGHVAMATFLHKENKGQGPRESLERHSLLPFAWPDVPKSIHSKGIALPVPEIAKSSRLLGHVTNVADEDGMTRRVRPFHLYEGHLFPLLGLSTYLVGQEVKDEHLVVGDKEKLSMLGKNLPIDSLGRVLLKFSGKDFPYETYPAHQVITTYEGINEDKRLNLDKNIFEDCYVLFGHNALGLKDSVLLPNRSSPTSGVYVHAVALDNYLSDNFMQEVPRSVVLLTTVVLCLLLGWLSSYVFDVKKIVLTVLSLFVIPLGLGVLAYHMNYWWPDTQLCLVLLATFGSAQVFNYVREGNQKRIIKRAFEHYLHKDVISELIEDPSKLLLGGTSKEMTILFSDIQGFSAISEKITPHDLALFMKRYLTELTDIILDEGGCLDKYIGDAIVAFWNAPLDQEDHALRACRAAIRCQKRLKELEKEFIETVGCEIVTRIGLHTGEVKVGNFGSSTRFDYTFLGDAGNLASRLEGANKFFGTHILISEETKKSKGQQGDFRMVGRIRVKGRETPVVVYEPLIFESQLGAEDLRNYKRAMSFLDVSDWEKAYALFSEIKGDVLSQKYAQKCRALFGTSESSWDGIWTLKEK